MDRGVGVDVQAWPYICNMQRVCLLAMSEPSDRDLRGKKMDELLLGLCNF